MNIIFYNVERFAPTLQAEINLNLSKNCNVSFHSSNSLEDLIKYMKFPTCENIIFYQIVNRAVYNELVPFIDKQDTRFRYIAICRDYSEGIEVLNNGSFYALTIPFKPKYVLQCCLYIEFGYDCSIT